MNKTNKLFDIFYVHSTIKAPESGNSKYSTEIRQFLRVKLVLFFVNLTGSRANSTAVHRKPGKKRRPSHLPPLRVFSTKVFIHQRLSSTEGHLCKLNSECGTAQLTHPLFFLFSCIRRCVSFV